MYNINSYSCTCIHSLCMNESTLKFKCFTLPLFSQCYSESFFLQGLFRSYCIWYQLDESSTCHLLSIELPLVYFEASKKCFLIDTELLPNITYFSQLLEDIAIAEKLIICYLKSQPVFTTCMYTYIYTCMYIYMDTYVCLYVYIKVLKLNKNLPNNKFFCVFYIENRRNRSLSPVSGVVQLPRSCGD